MTRQLQRSANNEPTSALLHAPKLSRRARAVDAAKNVGVLGILWVAYGVVRSLTGDNLTDAVEHSANILLLQESIGLPQESSIQHGFLEHVGVFRAANLYYMWAHFPVTGAFLVWTWMARRAYFPIIRNVLIIVTGAGLAIHVLYPLAPPRMLPNFIDTGILFGPSPYDLDSAAKAANQLAAMPSLHVGWALLVSLSFIAVTRSRLRFLSLAHPAVTAFVVVLTANHYWTDAIVAVALVMVAWTMVWRREQRLAMREIRARNISKAPSLFGHQPSRGYVGNYFAAMWPSDSVNNGSTSSQDRGADYRVPAALDCSLASESVKQSTASQAQPSMPRCDDDNRVRDRPIGKQCRDDRDLGAASDQAGTGEADELWGNDPRLDEFDSVCAGNQPFGADCPFSRNPERHELSRIYRDAL